MRSLLCALLLLSTVAAASAQDTAGTGAIAGVVLTAEGPAANVAVCIPALGRCDVTGGAGAFRLGDLRDDEYALEVSAPGRQLLSITARVRAGLATVLEVTLPDERALTETVTVTAARFITAVSSWLLSASTTGRSRP